MDDDDDGDDDGNDDLDQGAATRYRGCNRACVGQRGRHLQAQLQRQDGGGMGGTESIRTALGAPC